MNTRRKMKFEKVSTRWLFVVNETGDEYAEVKTNQRIHKGTQTPIKWNNNGKDIQQ